MNASEPTDEEALALGREAAELLANETFRKLFDHLAATTITEWRATASGSHSLREQLFHQVHGLDAIKGLLGRLVDEANHIRLRQEKAEQREAERAQRQGVFSRQA